MADISRAMQTPPPGAQPPAPAPAPQPTAQTNDADAKREAKNERDRLRRKEKRAADAKAAAAAKRKATKKKAAPKRKPAKKKAAPKRVQGSVSATGHVRKRKRKAKLAAVAGAVPKKRGRGRPPGAKNKPKIGVIGTPGTAAKAMASVAANVTVPAGFSLTSAFVMLTPDDMEAVQNVARELSNIPLVRRAHALALLIAMFK